MSVAVVIGIVIVSGFISIGFALGLIKWLFKKDQGTDKMKEISSFIQEGAWGYLRQQYKIVAIFFIVMFGILLFMSLKGLLVIFVPFAFLTGGFWSALCGWIGMMVATRSNARTTFAAQSSLNQGLKTALGAGTVMGLMVVGLGLLDLALFLQALMNLLPLPQPCFALVWELQVMLFLPVWVEEFIPKLLTWVQI